MNFSLKHAVALLSIATFGLMVGVPLAASGMSLKEAGAIFLEIIMEAVR